MKASRFVVTLLVVAATLLPEIVLAQATGGAAGSTGTIGSNPAIGGGNAGCTAITNSAAVQAGNGWLAGIVVMLTGMPFKAAAALSFVMGAIMLFLDSGQLGQHVRHIITIVLGIVLTGLIVGFLFGPSVAIAQC